jgi:hypothetical protein
VAAGEGGEGGSRFVCRFDVGVAHPRSGTPSLRSMMAPRRRLATTPIGRRQGVAQPLDRHPYRAWPWLRAPPPPQLIQRRRHAHVGTRPDRARPAVPTAGAGARCAVAAAPRHRPEDDGDVWKGEDRDGGGVGRRRTRRRSLAAPSWFANRSPCSGPAGRC